jgi:serine/threonine-protein kinase
MLKRIIDRRYRLEQLLASDDAGELHRGTDLTTGETVAVRLVAPRIANAVALAAGLQRQFQVMRQIRHPSILQVYQYGQTIDRSHYLAMEYLPGATLEETIAKSGAIPADRVSRLLDQMASALDAAHAQNLLHESLTASAIVVYVDQMGGERCKINGFVAVEESTVLGDPRYAFAQGMQRDLHKLVALVVHMLGGKSPVEKHEANGENARPARLSEATRMLRVPDAVQRVVMNAIQQAADGGIPSALDFAQRFREALGEKSAGIEGLVAAAAGVKAPVVRRQAAPTTVIRAAARVQPSVAGAGAFEIPGSYTTAVEAPPPPPMVVAPTQPTRPASGFISAESKPADSHLRRISQATRVRPQVTKAGVYLDWATIRFITLSAILCILLLSMSFAFKN